MKALNTHLYKTIRPFIPKGQRMGIRRALDECLEAMSLPGEGTIGDFCIDVTCNSLDTAMVWSHTPQGHEFWRVRHAYLVRAGAPRV